MKVSFYLTRPKAETETAIWARLCWAGYKFKYFIPEAINPKFWNKDTQRAKETQKFREYPEFNARLDNIKSTIKNIYRSYINDNNNTIPRPENLKPLLDKEIKKIEPIPTNNRTFFGLFKEIMDQTQAGTRIGAKGRPVTHSTYKTYLTVYSHLQDFQKTRKQPIDFNTIDTDFYTDYTSYLMKGKRLNPKTGKLEPLNLSSNTVGKHIQVIKLVLNEATDRGMNTNLKYKSKKFKIITEKADSIYLNKEELAAIEALDLSGNSRLERVRDLFLVGCYTGLRYSDYSKLRPENVSNGFIEIVQTKTNDPVVIPVHNTVKRIMDKYNGQLPASISNQKTNDYLKQIGEKVTALDVPVSRSMTKGGMKVIENFRKWELLTTHTARRSFASNEYLAGTPAITIMAITGHRTEKSFLSYIKITPSEHAKLLKSHWQNRNELKAV